MASEQVTAQPVRRLDMNRLRGHDLARNCNAATETGCGAGRFTSSDHNAAIEERGRRG